MVLLDATSISLTDKLLDLVVILLGVGIPAVVTGFIMMFRKFGKVEKSLATVGGHMANSCRMFQQQLDALHREKDRILDDADREHTRMEGLIGALDREVRDYQSKFHVRSEDIVRILEHLDGLDRRIEALDKRMSTIDGMIAKVQTDVTNLGKSVKSA